MLITLFIVILGILIINTLFVAIPYLSPRINMIEILSYQVFVNMLFFLFMMLPKNLGSSSLLK